VRVDNTRNTGGDVTIAISRRCSLLGTKERARASILLSSPLTDVASISHVMGNARRIVRGYLNLFLDDVRAGEGGKGSRPTSRLRAFFSTSFCLSKKIRLNLVRPFYDQSFNFLK
jgi:hypothetical protein